MSSPSAERSTTDRDPWEDPEATRPPAASDTGADPLPTVGASTSTGERFQILRPHAKGGLGQVSVAQDRELRREVALKEIQDRHADDPERRARFLLEAEITGGLEHPGVVPVYGLGVYPDGRPFYAMRLIKGDSLQEAIRRFHDADIPGRDAGERSLALRQLLGRFVAVCNAVAYAHSRGVIHRDLKPANVMLGSYGETLVVDWGLAKVVGRPGEPGASETGGEEATLQPTLAGDSAPTQLGTMLGTPAYMSPEQAAGQTDRVGPASDVYGLGATLYSLLTGKRPVESKDRGVLLEKVRRGEIIPPRQIQRSAPAALEAICLKAMARVPEERHESARALAEDIDRWLADEPVTAYREPWWTRLARWRRRHRPLVAGLSAALAVLVAGGVTFGWWYHEEQTRQAAELARRQADVERDVAVALTEATTLADRALTLTDQPAAWAGTLRAARHAVQLAEALLAREGEVPEPALRERVQAVGARVEADDRDRQLADRVEEIRLETAEVDEQANHFRVEDAYPKLRDAFRSHGLDFGQRSVRSAVAWLQQRQPPVRKHLVAALDACLDEAPRREGRVRRWLAAVLAGADSDSWRRQVRSALADRDVAALRQCLQTVVLENHPPGFLVWMVRRLPNEAGINRRRLLQRIRDAYPADFWANHGLAFDLAQRDPPLPREAVRYYTAAQALRPANPGVLVNLAIALHAQNDTPTAIRVLRQAIALNERYAGAHNNLGAGYVALKDFRRAIRHHRRAIELNPNYAGAHFNLGVALQGSQEWPRAAQAFHRAIALNARAAAAHRHRGAIRASELDLAGAQQAFFQALLLDLKSASAWLNVGVVRQAQKDLPGAARACRMTLELNPRAVLAYYNLSLILSAQHDYPGAIRAIRQAIVLNPRNAEGYDRLSVILQGHHDLPGAIQAARQSIALNPRNANAYNTLGVALAAQRDLPGAAQAYRKAIQLNSRFALAYNNLGKVLAGQHDLPGAIEAFHKALDLDPTFAEAYFQLGNALMDKKDLPGAIRAFRQAIKLNPQDAKALNNLGNALTDMKDLPGAIAAYRRAIQAAPRDATLYHNLGVALAHQNDLAGAIAAQRMAIQIDPHYARAYHSLGNALHGRKDLPGAVAAFRKAVDVDPKYANAYGGLGSMLLIQQDVPGAIKAYRKALDLNPQLAEAYLGLGSALKTRKDLRGAMEAYQKAIALSPRYAQAYAALGEVLAERGDFPGAVKACRKAVDLDPQLARAYYHLGAALGSQEKWPEAMEAFRQALRLDPKDAKAQYNLGVTLARQQDWLGAIEAYRKAIELNPRDAASYYNLGIVLRVTQDLPGAIEAYRKAVELNPKFYQAHYNLGNALAARKDLPGAIKAFRRAIDANPRFAEGYGGLGAALAAQRDLTAAVQAYRQSIALNPRDATVYTNLGSALAAKKDLAGAIQAYRKALAINPRLGAAHQNLGLVFWQQGEFAQALAAWKQAVQRLPASDRSRVAIQQALPLCQRMADLEAKLPGVLDGKQAPGNARERIEYAQVCAAKWLTGAAVRLYEQAFAEETRLADELRAGHRYQAARMAALTGAGQGKDADRLEAGERARWRRQALQWLRADLGLFRKRSAESGEVVKQRLRQWQIDAALAGIRDPAALAKLAAEEQTACKKLWAEVERLAKGGDKP
jgi:tetratricopeptide (TPR) repeat protein/serine/threonine protein kinase